MGEDKQEASPQFLAGFGEEGTDVFESAAPSSAGLKFERQFMLTALAGPQMGLAREVDEREMVLGRGETCSLVLNDPGLSRRHCRLLKVAEPEGERLYIEDLDSSNGTFVDGEIVRGRCRLPEGSRIHLGRHTVLSVSRQDPLERHAARQLYESSMRDPLDRAVQPALLRPAPARGVRLLHPPPAAAVDHPAATSTSSSGSTTPSATPPATRCCRHVARLIKRCVRQEDVAFRLGGEEFGVMVRSESHEGARAVAERMRKRLEDTPVYFGEHLVFVTSSLGIATAAPPDMTNRPTALLAAADHALYRAKADGRNRCEA